MKYVSVSSEVRMWEAIGRLTEENPYAVALYFLALPHGADGTLLPKTARDFWVRVAPMAMMPLEDTSNALRDLLNAGLIEETGDGYRLLGCSYWMPAARSNHQRRKSQKLRIIERDGWTCFYCGRENLRLDEIEIDHKLPVSRGGPNTMDNLVTACRECNQRKGTMTAEEFIVQEAS